jgi:hypothetical protein
MYGAGQFEKSINNKLEIETRILSKDKSRTNSLYYNYPLQCTIQECLNLEKLKDSKKQRVINHPGVISAPSTFDPREREWYKKATGKKPNWSSIYRGASTNSWVRFYIN